MPRAGPVPARRISTRKIVTEAGGAERHFSQMQRQYRLMASTWMLAMCAGVGFTLFTQLWNLDLRAHHQLLDCCFVEGLRLETEHPWLPQLRRRMLQTQPGFPGGRPVGSPTPRDEATLAALAAGRHRCVRASERAGPTAARLRPRRRNRAASRLG